MLRSFGSFMGIVALAILSPVFPAEGSDPFKALSVIPTAREPAPEFLLTRVGGEAVKLSDYGGRVVLLGFFKTF